MSGLTDLQREVLTRMAAGKRLRYTIAFGDVYYPLVYVGDLKITQTTVNRLSSLGLIERTGDDPPSIYYGITPAGRAAVA